jgi:hypothetical protein
MRSFTVTRYRDIVREKLGIEVEQMVAAVYEARGRELFARREAERRAALGDLDAWRAEGEAIRAGWRTRWAGRFPASGR